MPELPEVETIARTLAPQILGRTVHALHLLTPSTLQAGAERLEAVSGATVVRVFRRAKLLLVELRPAVSASRPGPEALLLAFHLKMTGRFFVYPPDTEPGKHTRLVLDFAGSDKKAGERLFFDDMRKFGYCRIQTPEELQQWDFWRNLGPEPLLCDPEALADRFASRRCAIKAALLDQTVVAGVGNIYADEALFRAGIAPTARAADIRRKRLVRLGRSLQDVLQQSIEECGSSIRDYRDARGNAGAFQNNFAVYGRKGASCRTCGTPLESCRVAGRATVFCPACQK